MDTAELTDDRQGDSSDLEKSKRPRGGGGQLGNPPPGSGFEAGFQPTKAMVSSESELLSCRLPKVLCRFEVSISVSSIEHGADSQQSVSEAGH